MAGYSAITAWRTGYERVFNPPTAEPAKDKAATDKTTVENISAIMTLLQQLAGQPQLAEAALNEINTSGILRAELEIDFSAMAQEQEQQPDMGMDDDVDFTPPH